MKNKWDLLTSFAPKFEYLGSSSVHSRLIHDTNINSIWRVFAVWCQNKFKLISPEPLLSARRLLSFSLHAKSMSISYDVNHLLLPRTQNISNYVSRGLFTARDCGGDTGNGASTIENNGSWDRCPCLGSVWTFLHNVLESTDPGPILSPISGPVQCEYTITLFY